MRREFSLRFILLIFSQTFDSRLKRLTTWIKLITSPDKNVHYVKLFIVLGFIRHLLLVFFSCPYKVKVVNKIKILKTLPSIHPSINFSPSGWNPLSLHRTLLSGWVLQSHSPCLSWQSCFLRTKKLSIVKWDNKHCFVINGKGISQMYRSRLNQSLAHWDIN